MLTEYQQALNEAGVKLSPDFCGRLTYNDFDWRLDGTKRISRQEYVSKYSFAIPNIAALLAIKACGPIIEVGSGSGYWAYELQKLNVDIIPTDLYSLEENTYNFTKQWCEIGLMPAIEAAATYSQRALMLVWPSYAESWAYEACLAYSGNTIIFVGEGSGGCTGCDQLHELFETFEEQENINIPVWFGIHDRLSIFKRTNTKGVL